MIIRKEYKFEAGHVVRGCNSTRCKYNMHGHSYRVEVFFKAPTLTEYGMVIDFGDLKENVGKFLDRFDHSFHFWDKESEEFKNFIMTNNERWISLPFSPTAENYALYFLKQINNILQTNKWDDKDRVRSFDNTNVICSSVRVHETATGYAEAFTEDLYNANYVLGDIVFSDKTFSS